eukprot:9468679-Pyramimonas_sp.AAC.1
MRSVERSGLGYTRRCSICSTVKTPVLHANELELPSGSTPSFSWEGSKLPPGHHRAPQSAASRGPVSP